MHPNREAKSARTGLASFSRRQFVTSVLKPLSCSCLLASTSVVTAAEERNRPNDHTDVGLSRYLDYVALRNRIAELLDRSGDPKIGVFWFVQEPIRAPLLLASSVYLQQGKRYGLYIDGPDDHVSGWTSFGRMIRQFMDVSLHDSAPNDWPRGRVLFNTATRFFEVGLTKHLLAPHLSQFQREILDYFRLPKASTVFTADSHYSETRFTLGEHGPRERWL
jgi:hypothetical protein